MIREPEPAGDPKARHLPLVRSGPARPRTGAARVQAAPGPAAVAEGRSIRKPPPLFRFHPWGPGEPRIVVNRLDRDAAVRRLPPHGHRFPVLIYIERGRGRHRVGPSTWDAAAGDLFVIAPGEVHDARALGEAEGWSVLFSAEAIDPSRSDTGFFLHWLDNVLLLPFLRPSGVELGPVAVPPPARAVWADRLRLLERELRAKRSGYREAARAYLTLMLADASRMVSDRVNVGPIRERPLLAEVFQIIEARYAEPISLATVAQAVRRSPSYLTDLVRKLTGRTVLGWIVERRMAEARRRLLETDEHVEIIGERLGYKDTTHFIRQFRRANGMTPAAWRRANR